jgi:hypothetical protein
MLPENAGEDLILTTGNEVCGCLELFAGSGKLTRTFKRKAVKCTAVDNLRNKNASLVPCLKLDLTVAADQKHILQLLASGRIRFVWMAPPCGTASRARERPLSPKLFGAWGKAPIPLRTDDEPEGLSTLSGNDLLRVQAANALYRVVMTVVQTCRRLRIYYCIENPGNSLFWVIPWVHKEAQFREPSNKQIILLDTDEDIDVRYHACMHGGTRNKNQRLRTNLSQLEQLQAICDNKHTHAPWGRQRSRICYKWLSQICSAPM